MIALRLGRLIFMISIIDIYNVDIVLQIDTHPYFFALQYLNYR